MGTQRGRRQLNGAFDEQFFYSGTLDVASLADGAGASSSVTVPGVALGDMVLGVSHGVSTAGITVTANVTAADTVVVRFQNESGGTLDLASTTLRLWIGRPNAGAFA
jgi:hypothetical protein